MDETRVFQSSTKIRVWHGLNTRLARVNYGLASVQKKTTYVFVTNPGFIEFLPNTQGFVSDATNFQGLEAQGGERSIDGKTLRCMNVWLGACMHGVGISCWFSTRPPVMDAGKSSIPCVGLVPRWGFWTTAFLFFRAFCLDVRTQKLFAT